MQVDISQSTERPLRGQAPTALQNTRASASERTSRRNVGETERVVSSLIGGVLMLSAVRRPSVGSASRLLAGGALLHRGLTGRCYVYQALGRNTADPAQESPRPVQRTITIGKPAEELYRAWRDPKHVEAIMGHFARVEGQGEGRFRWTVSLPGKRELTWNTYTVDAQPGELIAWRTQPDAPFEHTGSVQFKKAPGSLGTEVTLKMSFGSPQGALQTLTSKFLRKIPQLLEENILRRCKSLCETGEIPTLERNSAARPSARTERAQPSQQRPVPSQSRSVS